MAKAEAASNSCSSEVHHASPRPSVILVGVGGFGAWHLNNIRRLQESGHVTLTALVDPVIKATSTDPIPSDAPLFDTFAEAIAHVTCPDIVVSAVPIHLHATVAREALLAGADLLLEKPPFATMSDFQDLLELEQRTGQVIQIAFQSLGSAALDASISEETGIGEIRAVRAMATWVRAKWYWERAPWVGRRSIGNVDVVDGVATNAIAHSVVTALHVAKVRRVEDVEQVEVEMYRANPIDVDDTTSIRVTTTDGRVVTANLTLSAAERGPVEVEVVGSEGTASFFYETDDIRRHGDEATTQHYEREDLLENLVAHRKQGIPLRAPLRDTGAFMRVLEAIRTGGEPIHIERRWLEKRGEGKDQHVVIQDVAKWIRAAANIDGLFSEAGAPWAFTRRDNVLAKAELDGRVIMQVVDGAGTTPSSSPRPYVHPIHTLAGVEVTATHPADHDWHMGLGMAIPDINGSTFWGGPTYVRDQGYTPLDNYGSMITESIEPVFQHERHVGLDHHIIWHAHEGDPIIRELRRLHWYTFEAIMHRGFHFLFESTMTALDRPVSLGGPGTNGRENAGYGGFFWRLPRCSDIVIMSATQEGEDVVHGSVSPWLSWSAHFEARPGATGPATLIVVPQDTASRNDPWFVRCTGYPGIGSAIAWKDRVEMPARSTLTRSFRCAVIDGCLERHEIETVVDVLHGR